MSNIIGAFILGFGFVLGNFRYWANADPIGAIMIGLIIIVNWYREGMEHVLNLAGAATSTSFSVIPPSLLAQRCAPHAPWHMLC